MKYRALRGVCIGPGRNLAVGDDPAELDNATAQFLISIGAVEKVEETKATAPAGEPPDESKLKPAKAGKEK